MSGRPRAILVGALAAAALAFGSAGPLAGQDSTNQHQPRQIAPTMSYIHADWLTRPEREREEQPDRVVASLRIPRGATVIDLGAGVGYFTWRLAKQVGPHGKVIAVDIQSQMLDMLSENMRKRRISNVETILGTPSDPRLAEDSADLALLVDVYHELAYPAKIMASVRRALRPGGRLAIVEYRKEDPWIPIHPLHKMTVEEVKRELEPIGFEPIEVLDFLPWQHIVVFARSED